jgi:hypothetical protein
MAKEVRVVTVITLTAIALSGLTGCVGSRLERQVEWLEELDGIEFAEIVAEDLDSSALNGVVRGELARDLTAERVQELARLTLEYQDEHGGTLRLGRDLVDFEIQGQATTPAYVDKWHQIVGTPGVLSGLVGFTGTDVRIIRSNTREVLERLRDFPGSLHIVAFQTREESELDRRADDSPVSRPDPDWAGLVFVIDADCEPTDAELQRALLIAEDAESDTGTFVVCDD